MVHVTLTARASDTQRSIDINVETGRLNCNLHRERAKKSAVFGLHGNVVVAVHRYQKCLVRKWNDRCCRRRSRPDMRIIAEAVFGISFQKFVSAIKIGGKSWIASNNNNIFDIDGVSPHRDATFINILICCDSFYCGNAVGCNRSQQ